MMPPVIECIQSTIEYIMTDESLDVKMCVCFYKNAKCLPRHDSLFAKVYTRNIASYNIFRSKHVTILQTLNISNKAFHSTEYTYAPT